MSIITNFPVVVSGYMKSMGIPPLVLLIIAFIVAFLLILLLWLALRKVKLWYWKTGDQIQVLKSIDASLKNIAEQEMQSDVNDGSNVQSCKDVLAQNEDTEELEQPEGHGKFTGPKKGMYFDTGKSGRVYTVEELELQIRE